MANRKLVPGAEKALEDMKQEVASSLNVKLIRGYNGDLTSRQAGSVGGEMVKRMIRQYQQGLAGTQS